MRSSIKAALIGTVGGLAGTLAMNYAQRSWTLAVAGDCRVLHDEGSSLGRWSAERWEMLFRGMVRFLQIEKR